jgi:hypothetical protein
MCACSIAICSEELKESRLPVRVYLLNRETTDSHNLIDMGSILSGVESWAARAADEVLTLASVLEAALLEAKPKPKGNSHEWRITSLNNRNPTQWRGRACRRASAVH